MNAWLAAAAALAFVVGLAHSVLGEILIFRALRAGSLVPTLGGTALRERQVRILWATWHVVTAIGWGIAALLWLLAGAAGNGPAANLVVPPVAAAMAAAALIVCVATRGRHPGWIGLLGVALLSLIGVAPSITP